MELTVALTVTCEVLHNVDTVVNVSYKVALSPDKRLTAQGDVTNFVTEVVKPAFITSWGSTGSKMKRILVPLAVVAIASAVAAACGDDGHLVSRPVSGVGPGIFDW